MKYKFHAQQNTCLTLEIEAKSLEAANEIAENSDGGAWKDSDLGDFFIDYELTEELK